MEQTRLSARLSQVARQNFMLKRTSYFVREHTGLLKLTDTYDILDFESQEQIGVAKEEISGFIKMMRLLVNKQLLPTTVNVYEGTAENPGSLVFSIARPMSLLRQKVTVLGSDGQEVGYFRSKLLSLGGAFSVHLSSGEEIAQVKGDWKGWNFKFLSGETELGRITKKWSGLGKELFTSADNYIISLTGEVDEQMSLLLLAGGLAVDTVYKENK